MLSLNERLKQTFEERESITANKRFVRMIELGQVQTIRLGESEVIKNRLTHSYDVANSAEMIALSLAMRSGLTYHDIDHQGAIYNAGLLHDCGHPPFSHIGSRLLNKQFKALGLTRGFDDNNNNLVVVEKNKIALRDYTLASIIKRPMRLYEDQKNRYLPLIQQACECDRQQLANVGITFNSHRTLACCIMNEADTNSYICSDLTDFLCLGNQITAEQIQSLLTPADQIIEQKQIEQLIAMMVEGSKSEIKTYFNQLKMCFNQNYGFVNGEIAPIDLAYNQLRQFLWRIERTYYINPLKENGVEALDEQRLMTYINKVLNESFYPSKYYAKKIAKAKSLEEKLRYQCDMIAETTDCYVLKQTGVTQW